MSRSQVSQIPFGETETCGELQKAWAISEAARLLYQRAAENCEGTKMHLLAHAFRFTAAQEKEHAAIFSGLLAVYGGAAPKAVPPSVLPCLDPAALLEAVADLEEQTSRAAFPESARIAEREGYPRIALTFSRIGETEALHGQRFRQYAQALRDGSLFRDDARVGWLCLPCGQLHYGTDAPEVCAACGSTWSFIRSNFHPFQVDGRRRTENCIPPATVV